MKKYLTYTYSSGNRSDYFARVPVLTLFKDEAGEITYHNHSHPQAPLGEIMFPLGEYYGFQQREWKFWFGLDQYDQALYRFQVNKPTPYTPNVGNPTQVPFGTLVDKFDQMPEEFFKPSLEIQQDLHTLQRIELTRSMYQFNWYNLAGRPHMKTLSSLKATERHRLKSNRGSIVMLDFQSYFLQRLAKQVGYQFSGYPYDELGIEKTKLFPILFGELPLPRNEFFDLVRPVKEQFQDGGVVTLPNGKICDTFFHYSTNAETWENMGFARMFMDSLPESLIFYLYDAFIFDLAEDEMDEFINLCGKLPYKFTAGIGPDWGNLEPFPQLSEFAFS